MTKRVLVPLAEGFEEIEAMTVVDILRRGEVEVVTAGLKDGAITGRSSIAVLPDKTLDEALADGEYDMIVCPGGLPGSHYLRDDPRVIAALKRTAEAGGFTAAICAAPLVLDRAGLLDGATQTSHPSVEEELPLDGYLEERVVTSGKVVTSRAPGTAMEFAFTLLGALRGAAAVDEVNQGVLARL